MYLWFDCCCWFVCFCILWCVWWWFGGIRLYGLCYWYMVLCVCRVNIMWGGVIIGWGLMIIFVVWVLCGWKNINCIVDCLLRNVDYLMRISMCYDLWLNMVLRMYVVGCLVRLFFWDCILRLLNLWCEVWVIDVLGVVSWVILWISVWMLCLDVWMNCGCMKKMSSFLVNWN